MDVRETLRQAVENLSDHPRRIIASSMGVFWGAAAVVLLMSFGAGLGEYSKKEWDRFAEDFIMVLSGLTGADFPGYHKGVWVEMSRQDAAKVEIDLQDMVRAILPEHMSDGEVLVEARRRTQRLPLSATDHRYFEYRNFDVGWGRLLDAEDVALARYVVVLGYDAARLLFDDPGSAVGETIRIRSLPFEIIGVARRKGRQYNDVRRPDDKLLLTPITTAEAHLGFSKDAVSRLWIFRRAQVPSDVVLGAFRKSLGPRARFHPDDSDALYTFDGSVFRDLFELFSTGFMIFVGIAGTITLLIGGVGIANYHLATLAERTVEIAVAKTIGARNRVLVAQTLLESTLVSAGASLSGTLLGLVGCAVIRLVASPERFPLPVVAPAVLVVALLAGFAVSVLAGVLPAIRVRRMEVSAALRAQR